VFFVAGPGQLNKADVEYLEAQLVSRASAAKRMPLDNGKRRHSCDTIENCVPDCSDFLRDRGLL
jgi:hypothetical protein